MPQISQLLNNRYRLHQHLSSNAGRQTWLAQDMTTASPSQVILKLLAFSPQMQWEEFQLFEREAEVLKSLRHSCIPRYRDYFSIDTHEGEGLHWFALVQDYIPGKSLQQLLNQGYHFNEQQVQAIAVQVLKILHDLHSLNPPILHRDLKPSNLIVGLYAVKRTANQQPHTGVNERRVYLIDFGTVCHTTAFEGANFTVVGTIGYAPLEQLWGKAIPASDLYVLGATLIHLATRIPPSELPQDNLRIQFRDKVSLDPQFVDWLEVLSEPNLERRFSSAQQALEAFRNRLTTNQPPESSQIQLKKSQDTLRIELPRSPVSVGKVLRVIRVSISLVWALIFVYLFNSKKKVFIDVLVKLSDSEF